MQVSFTVQQTGSPSSYCQLLSPYSKRHSVTAVVPEYTEIFLWKRVLQENCVTLCKMIICICLLLLFSCYYYYYSVKIGTHCLLFIYISQQFIRSDVPQLLQCQNKCDNSILKMRVFFGDGAANCFNIHDTLIVLTNRFSSVIFLFYALFKHLFNIIISCMSCRFLSLSVT